MKDVTEPQSYLGHQLEAVDGEEHTNREEGGALVAVHKRMVLRESEGARGRQIRRLLAL